MTDWVGQRDRSFCLGTRSKTKTGGGAKTSLQALRQVMVGNICKVNADSKCTARKGLECPGTASRPSLSMNDRSRQELKTRLF